MKTLFITLFLTIGLSSYSQVNTNQNINTETPIKENYDLKKFDLESSSEMSKWSEEEKKHFAKTFVFKKGGFTLPKEQINPYLNKN